MSPTATSYSQSIPVDLNVDALIVGAGFGGVYSLIQLRKLGLNAKIFEAGSDLGGVWYWNCYPGARVDSELPIYQLTMPELYKTWKYKEKYPGWQELREYFRYVDETLDLKKDVYFDSLVKEAVWDSGKEKWTVVTADGKQARARFFLLCTGVGSSYYIPEIKCLSSFKGVCHHTSRWPHEGVGLRGKRVGVIGTGATGVQVIQEAASVAGHLTVFQRTPNLALPMNQQPASPDLQQQMIDDLYPLLFKKRHQTFGGFTYDLVSDKTTFNVSPEERRHHYETIWAEGGFRFWIGNYADIFTDKAANDEASERGSGIDPWMKEKLAPMIPPHPFGMKRPSLEQRYYEVFNQSSNVTLVDVNETPIEEITPKGVKTKDGREYELDVLVLATGFDMVTGGITSINVKGTDGKPIATKWKEDGVHTYLGMTVATYPNMFIIYGPQGPTAFCNGPSCLELQGEWIVDCIKHMLKHGYTSIEADKVAENAWRQTVIDTTNKTLVPLAKSWYMGANIPGKKIEPLNFPGGVPSYRKLITDVVEKGYEGFVFAKNRDEMTDGMNGTEFK
ncbi:FAD/NAD(P)-binding domain-containing protein [Dendrothele bispora CBS 962.96]|uniref:FAD/NAD(P)-binding domain-containing protein n=1 Tax=Dendrothele bispora (strain CBS 962.96) TaxID=1314807 RepID=A0A4S8MT85_DENBC|nr:FAD/NAD(P)-binding domain-containing protein [Dendrothele bispora CBS 962.96]